VEDHPKMVTPETLTHNRQLGITAMEMGVQTTNDEIHRLTKRDSTREQLITRARLCKDFGFKTLAHIMPDLPGSSPELDIAAIDDILDGQEHIRLADHRQQIQLGAPVAVAAFAAGFWAVGGLYVAIIGTICAALAAVAFYHAVEKACWKHYYLFDYDRFKLYPTMVLEFSELKDWYLEGKFKPYFDTQPERLYDVIRHFLETVKPYQRVERVIRDMPASREEEATAEPTVWDDHKKHNYVVAGIHVTNAQEIAMQGMSPDKPCRCLRTREIKDRDFEEMGAHFFVERYYANRGEEYFLSFETKDRKYVYGFLKLRFSEEPYQAHLPKEIQGAALIRWLQVYGVAVPIGGGNLTSNSQHHGFGRTLMQKAEELVRKKGWAKIADISGIGVREYYRKLGYELEGTYMIKRV